MIEQPLPAPDPGPEPGQTPDPDEGAANEVPDWSPAQWHSIILGFLVELSHPERGRAQVREGLLDGHRVVVIGFAGDSGAPLAPGTRPDEIWPPERHPADGRRRYR